MGEIRPTGHLIAQTPIGDDEGEIRVANDPERAIAVFLRPGGRVESTNRGPSPQGEGGAIHVAGTVVWKLREQGETWEEPYRPVGPEMGWDALSDGPSGQLKFQVTRAIQDQHFWVRMSRGETVTANRSLADCADELWCAILSKAGIGSKDRSEIILALDAFETLEIALPHVAAAFQVQHGTEAAALGFRAIWLVGPITLFTFRLA